MRIYQVSEINELNLEKGLVDSFIDMIEKDTEKEIFTMRILDRTEEGLHAFIVFKDETILDAIIEVGEVKGKLAIRMKGNYI